MGELLSGVIIFCGIHLLPAFPGARDGLRQRMGALAYRGVFSLVALAGLVLIIHGKGNAPFTPVYPPPGWGGPVTAAAMLLALMLLPAAYVPSNVKRFTAHPMLWATVLWALGHLLSNGDLASIILFGGLGLFALVDIWSANRRGASTSQESYPRSRDLALVVLGVVLYVLFVWLHPRLFGVAAIAV